MGLPLHESEQATLLCIRIFLDWIHLRGDEVNVPDQDTEYGEAEYDEE